MNQITQLLNLFRNDIQKENIIDNKPKEKPQIIINIEGDLNINIKSSTIPSVGLRSSLDEYIINDMEERKEVYKRFYKANC